MTDGCSLTGAAFRRSPKKMMKFAGMKLTLSEENQHKASLIFNIIYQSNLIFEIL